MHGSFYKNGYGIREKYPLIKNEAYEKLIGTISSFSIIINIIADFFTIF